jgi:hypothetical protein
MAVRFNESGYKSGLARQLNVVMRGLVSRIHVCRVAAEGVDGRHKAGHDDDRVSAPERSLLSAVPKPRTGQPGAEAGVP